MRVILEVNDDGNLHGLYTDAVDLFAVGPITNVTKASNVEFNEAAQKWEVMSLDGEVLYTNSNREKAIEWEIDAFSPGGKYYHGIR
jgi:hypothetical protein